MPLTQIAWRHFDCDIGRQCISVNHLETLRGNCLWKKALENSRGICLYLPLKSNQSLSKLGSLPVEVIGSSSQGQNASRPLVSEACLRRFRVIFFNSASTWADTRIRVPLAYFGKKVDELEPWKLFICSTGKSVLPKYWLVLWMFVLLKGKAWENWLNK